MRHEVSEVVCDFCGHDWVAVRPTGTPTLECPRCSEMTLVTFDDTLGDITQEEFDAMNRLRAG